jgi:hypothetical protein
MFPEKPNQASDQHRPPAGMSASNAIGETALIQADRLSGTEPRQ